MEILEIIYKSPKKRILKNFPPAKLVNPIIKITKKDISWLSDLSFRRSSIPLVRKYYPQ